MIALTLACCGGGALLLPLYLALLTGPLGLLLTLLAGLTSSPGLAAAARWPLGLCLLGLAPLLPLTANRPGLLHALLALASLTAVLATLLARRSLAPALARMGLVMSSGAMVWWHPHLSALLLASAGLWMGGDEVRRYGRLGRAGR